MSTLAWQSVTGTHRRAKICVVVLPCPSCEVPHHIGVTVEADAFSYCIPERCACGAGLRTAAHHADIVDTARNLLTYGGAA